ncbi:hypothetical protein [Georgenia alba]|uniref:Uncharacterized protein n=1 Tax=Georgenia alba TaxID=2233858 RepID=A0ABW2QDZ1_9MICO
MTDGPGSRAATALRTALIATAGACVGLGVLGAALVLLSGDTDPWPGLSLLLAGQATALVAAVVSGIGLRRVLTGSAPQGVTPWVRRTLSRLVPVLLAVLVTGVAAWIALRPGAWLAVVTCALVTAQLAAMLRWLSR